MLPTVSPTKMKVVTSSPTTISPTTIPPTTPIAPTAPTSSCPPQYQSGQTYNEGDLVSNPIPEIISSSIPYFKCREFPFTPWCSQPAYEPGVTMSWEQAWELVGVCDVDGGSGGTSTSTAATTLPSSTTTTASTTTTVATIPPPISTPATPPPPQPPTISTTTTPSPTKQPTTPSSSIIPSPSEEDTITGPLPVQFQYEIGNNENLQSQSILTSSNPVNDMMMYIESGTDGFVSLIVDETFHSGSGSGSGIVSKERMESDEDENVRGRNRLRKRKRRLVTRKDRHLEVIYTPSSVSISRIEDIACSYQNMTALSRCQRVTADLTLDLVNEPPLTSRLRFQTGISRGIQQGLLTFSPESGIVYVGETPLPIQVIEGVRIPDNGSGGSGSSSNDKWVVPVSVAAAAIVAVILVLFAGTQYRKRRRGRKEYDGNNDNRVPLDGNEVANDFLAAPSSRNTTNDRSSSRGRDSKRRMRNVFEETIEETPKLKEDDDSDLIDLEGGDGPVSMTNTRNPFDSSSSSSDSSSKGPQQQRTVGGGPLSSWKEVSEDDLDKSSELGETFMKDRDSSDYRAAVEALVRQTCPEHLESVDEMMEEYEGRETVLIGQLSAMLATQQKRNNNGEDVDGGGSTSGWSSSAGLMSVPESGAALPPSTSFDDDSSAAGSSQWSTEDGLSSIDASMSSSEKEMPDTYAAIGKAAMTISESNVEKRSTTFIQVDKNPDDQFSGLDIGGIDGDDSSSQSSRSSQKKIVTREDLDAAIEAGDWTAVGATAQLLASNTAYDRRDSGRVSETSASDQSEGVSLSSMDYSDQERAYEFERLIEAGDWKAVMAIASEFEGAGESDSLHVSKLSEMEYDRRLSSSSGPFNYDRDNTYESNRQQIEELVRRVVPDEIENIEEMLLQFKGRENELITTLQTMDERNLNSPGKSPGKSPGSSLPSSPESGTTPPVDDNLKQVPSFQEEGEGTVYENDSIVFESDYETDGKKSSSNNGSESKTSSSRKSSESLESESSSSSEDISRLVIR
jgi:hypothetical protein